jgi:hypothetical protein
MKTGRLFTAAAFLAAFSTSWGMVEAPGARSPIGSPTQVPSANRTAAIPSRPNLYGYVGNLTMTGNIGGGRHFRGFVPYSSSDYIDQRLLDPQSRAVSSFLRRSASGEAFFDPRQTVTSLQRPGGTGLTGATLPPQVRPTASKQWLESFDIADVIRPPEQRPLTTSTQTLESILQQMLPQRTAEPKAPPAASRQRTAQGLELSKTPAETRAAPILIDTTGQKPDSESAPGSESIYAQIRRQLGIPDKTESMEKEDLRSVTKEPDDAGISSQLTPTRSRITRRQLPQEDSPEERALPLNNADFEQFAAVRSENYLILGEEFLKNGQYYKAADAFELSCLWDRKNPLLVLARSHALFAAGEYMSSAYYLSQAIEMEPKVLESRLDWAALLNSRDTFETRLTELATWQQRSNSPELALLLGYVLLQDGKIIRARIAAEFAQDMMSDSPAAQSLLKAVQAAESSATP